MNYLDQFNKILNDMLENSVTKAEVKDVIDKFAESLKKTVSDLDTKLSTHKSEVTSETEKIRKDVKDVETKLRGLVSESNNKLSADIKVQLNELAASVGFLSDFVDNYEGYDDEELRGHLEEVKGMIPVVPEAYDPTEVMEELDELKENLTGLRKMVGSISVPSPVNWPRHESFTMNGSDTSITLQAAVGAAGTAIFGVRYQGQVLDMGNQYTVDGNKISFTFTPANGATISVSYYG